MKIGAITMVYRDYWALSQWYAHYSRRLGVENLFILSHGQDDRINAVCPNANVVVVPRSSLNNFDRQRADLLDRIQDELTGSYDWLIRTDVDELIYLNPECYGSFADLFVQQQDQTSLFALGLNLTEDAVDDELGPNDPVLLKRRNASFSGHYSKAWAVRGGTYLKRHGIKLTPDAAYTLPRGVYLLHLKYANIDALVASNEHRKIVARQASRGGPGQAWKDADADANAHYSAFEQLEVVDWDTAEAEAFGRIATQPVADRNGKVLRAPFVKFKCRTVLPDWFKDD